MSLVRLDSVIPLFEFSILFGLDEGVGNLDQKRFQIRISVGNAPEFYLVVALVIAGATAGPGDKMLR